MSEDQWFELTVVARNRIRVRTIEKTKMSTSSKETQRKKVEPKYHSVFDGKVFFGLCTNVCVIKSL